MKVKTLTFLSFMFILPQVLAQVAPPLAPPSQSMDKAKWEQQILSTLPQTLCKSDQYFIRCFETNEKDCAEFTTILVQACLKNISIALPSSLTKEQGEHWGGLVGRCTYDLYVKFMHPKVKGNIECQTPLPAVEQKPTQEQTKP